jgi:PhzF family phenazine biosynthesis protein
MGLARLGTAETLRGTMRRFAFKKLDAFATSSSAGNPAGAIYLEAGLDISVQEMQRIARELKGFVSEVGYVSRLDGDTFRLKYYSSEREVEFCGHATIAIMYDLFAHDPELAKKPLLNIVTEKGKLAVENRVAQEDAVFISAPVPSFSRRTISADELATALSVSAGALCPEYSASVVNAGLETLIVPVNGLDKMLAIAPRFDVLERFCVENSLDILTLFTDQVADEANRYRTRVFAPRFGYLEDPATGSGNAALGYYLLEKGSWDGSSISLEQNADRAHSNRIRLATNDSVEGEKRVIFGGGAIVRIAGEYLLA